MGEEVSDEGAGGARFEAGWHRRDQGEAERWVGEIVKKMEKLEDQEVER